MKDNISNHKFILRKYSNVDGHIFIFIQFTHDPKDSFKCTPTSGCFADHLFFPRPPDDFEKGNLSANVNVKSLKYTGHFRNDGSMTTRLHLVRTVMPCLFKDPYLWSSSDRANRKCKHLNSQTRCEAHTNEK